MSTLSSIVSHLAEPAISKLCAPLLTAPDTTWWLLCAVPLVLMSGVLLANRKQDRMAAIGFSRSGDIDVTPADIQVEDEWARQHKLTTQSLPGIWKLTALHGVTAALGVYIPGLILSRCPGVPLLHQLAARLERGGFDSWSFPEMCAIAALASVGVHIVLTYGQLFRRAARCDVAAMTVAEALRGLLVSVLSAIIVVSLMHAEQPWLSPRDVLLIGGAMGLLGPGLVDLIERGVAILVGLYSTSEDGLVDCTEVDGLDDVDRLRLQEMGIDSLHSLAHASVALVYLNSRYPYERICDWKDQALLQVLVGKGCKKWLVEQHGIRDATSLLAAEGLHEEVAKKWPGQYDCVARSDDAKQMFAWRRHRVCVAPVDADRTTPPGSKTQ